MTFIPLTSRFSELLKRSGTHDLCAAALWVEFAHIDAFDFVSTSPLSHSRTSPRAERLTVERSGVERNGALRSERASE